MARISKRHPPNCPSPRELTPALLAWFAVHARDLPWRRTRDPYAIWVSEIMLQQTQVKTVIPYWTSWMRELPTVQSLANARPAKVHKLWEGLGYYTRVRNLQRSAQQICVSHAGKFPDQFGDLLALPGIGRYTAGAIASIAFNQPAPILDGNVIRVLTRLHGIAADPHEKKTNARLWQLAEDLVRTAHEWRDNHPRVPVRRRTARKDARPTAACSHLNQSLMELGALVCTPRSPNCAACPVAKYCVAHRDGRVEELPRPRQRTAATARRFIAFVIEHNGRFLVRQRPEGTVNAHLWEFPNCEALANETAATVAEKHFNAKPRTIGKICVVRHSITRYRMSTEAYRLNLKAGGSQLGGVWRTLAQLHALPFTSAHRRIANQLEFSRQVA